MSQDSDIQNLFRQFNGQPTQYKEIARAEQNESARQRWPLLDAIRLHQDPVPPVRLAATVHVTADTKDTEPAEQTHIPNGASSRTHIEETMLAPTQVEPPKTSWFRGADHEVPATSQEPPSEISAIAGTSHTARLFSAHQLVPIPPPKPEHASSPAIPVPPPPDPASSHPCNKPAHVHRAAGTNTTEEPLQPNCGQLWGKRQSRRSPLESKMRMP